MAHQSNIKRAILRVAHDLPIALRLAQKRGLTGFVNSEYEYRGYLSNARNTKIDLQTRYDNLHAVSHAIDQMSN